MLLLVAAPGCGNLCDDACCGAAESSCESGCDDALDRAADRDCSAQVDALESCLESGYSCEADGSIHFSCDVQLASGCVAAAGPCSDERDSLMGWAGWY